MNIVDLGKKDFKEIWDLQKNIHEKRLEGKIEDTLLLVEHYPVITIGKSGKEANLLIPFKLLEKKGIAYYHIERGGDITYHGPGQIVGYPIFNIKEGLVGIKPFIKRLEDIIIATLSAFNIMGMKKEKMIGVWTEKGKICSLGIAVKRWVSFHGFALNVNTDLKNFDLIVPCGIKNVIMTSIKDILNEEVPMDEVKKHLIKNFGIGFKKNSVKKCLEELI